MQRVTLRQATWLVLRQPTHVTAEEQSLLDRLRQAHPAFEQAITLAQDFARRLRVQQPSKFEAWLQQATRSSLRDQGRSLEGQAAPARDSRAEA